jgi:small conductance mechanosensitive channel
VLHSGLGITQLDLPDADLPEVDPPAELAPWLSALGIFVVGIIVGRITGRVVRRLLVRTGVELSLAILLSRIVAWLIKGLALFYALAVLGVQLGPVLGALGLTGLVVALALQSVMEDVVAGLILQARRPFYVGDQVKTNDHHGNVVDITTRVVKIRSHTGELVFVPNRDVLSNVIINETRPGRRRLDVEVAVAYGTDLERACRVVEEAVADIDGVRHQPDPPRCFVEEFYDSGVSLLAMIWIDPPELGMWQIRSDAVIAIHEAFTEADITIPFPQQRLWFERPGDRRPGG